MSCRQFTLGLVLLLVLTVSLESLQAAMLVDHLPLGKQNDTTTETDLVSTPVTDSCPPWKYKENCNSSCTCGDSLQNIVLCDEDQSTIKLLNCHCMSHSEKSSESDMTLVGNCPYMCTYYFYTVIDNQKDIDDLCNQDLQLNRQGQMCGKCLENFAPSPYSYSFECTECSDYKNNWLKYLLIAFLPVTIFFITALIFRLNVMSTSINSFLFVCQTIGSSTVMRVVADYCNSESETYRIPLLPPFLKALSSFYGIWNLDFFRMVYEPFCLHPNLSILQILSLDYAIAVYPLFLICVTYFIIKLHDRFGVVQLLWKPAGRLVTCINHQWKTSNSLIQAFGTFFLLSCVKIINTSFDILMPVQLYNVSGKVVGLYVYNNGSMEYFGNDHLPYAVLAIFMFVTFNLMPLLLLCLYPCRCFQSCLNCCRLNSQVLRTFMDAFQGCYKFESYDCRYWAAFYPLLRIAFFVISALTQSGYALLVIGILLIPVASLLSVVRPYRENIYNVIDIIMFLTLILVCFSAIGFPLATFDQRYDLFTSITFFTGVFFPVLYIFVQLLMYVLPNRLVETTKKYLQHILCKKKDQSVRRNNPLL